MNKIFNVGDRVALLVNSPDANSSLFIGDTGSVCDIRGSFIGVKWDKLVVGGHGCHGHCEIGYGWEVLPGEITFSCIYDDNDDEIQQSDFDISMLM